MKSKIKLNIKKRTNILIVICLVISLSIIDSCKKEPGNISTVTDIEGNVYKTVAIGTQVWMSQSLKTTKYNNNTAIPNVTDTTAWRNLTAPAYSWYNNDIINKDIYGGMYNWYAVRTGKLCPVGWHAPTDEDFNTLELYLGMAQTQINLWGWRGTDQGAQMKNSTGWADAASNGTNKSGFAALAGGYRYGLHGTFNGLGVLSYFWTSTDDSINGNPTVAWYRRLDGVEKKIYKATTLKTGGKYIRCVKD